MRGLSLKCLIHGHDDRVRRTTGRLYLECAECGRETGGWAIPAPPLLHRGVPAQPSSKAGKPSVATATLVTDLLEGCAAPLAGA
jgi:hypothetical protein